MKKTILLVCILLAVFCCVASCAESKSSNPLPGRTPMMRWGEKADKLFPKPPVLLEYERVFDAYEVGKIVEELPTIRKLASQSVVLCSADVWAKDPDIFYSTYFGDRLLPAQNVMRRVIGSNAEYADKLANEGKSAEAISVLLLNLSIARQIVHIQPLDTNSMVTGNGLWQWTWCEMGKHLKSFGDNTRAKRAHSCDRQATSYVRSSVRPYIDATMHEDEAWAREMKRLPKSKREAFWHRMQQQDIRTDLLKAKQFVKEWDAHVDTVASKQLMKELQKEYALTE